MFDSVQFWPVPNMIPDSEMTEHNRQIVAFMDDAYESGFAPRFAPAMAIESENSNGRNVLLVRRGIRNGYEPFLRDNGGDIRLGTFFDMQQSTCVTIRRFHPPVNSRCDGFAMKPRRRSHRLSRDWRTPIHS